MKKNNRWINILILNFCVVALLGMALRSKILFSIPFLDYNRLLDAHFHFAFGGWVTLALAVLLVYNLLPATLYGKASYKWLLISILTSAWLLLLSSPLPANSISSSFFSTLFILVNYVFAWFFIRDIVKANISKTVRLLAVSSVVCLILSSFGVFTLAYLFASKSLNSFAYRDALYSYLHLQYNGFFTLAVFALLFQKLEPKMTLDAKTKSYQFSVLLCASTFPSLFLTYLWRDPNDVYRVIAVCGSVLLLLSFIWFVRLIPALKELAKSIHPLIRYMSYLCMAAFSLKIFLQSLTLFPEVGNAVFGDRPVIIGFLHLVFLGFVTPFIFIWFAQSGFLNIRLAFTKLSLIIFTIAVLLNEAVLMTQGLGAMLIKSSQIFPWVLWVLSIFLLIGAVLIAIARIKSIGAETTK